MLAPKAEVSMFPWKEPKERIPLAVRQIRSFLGRISLLLSRRLCPYDRAAGASSAALLSRVSAYGFEPKPCPQSPPPRKRTDDASNLIGDGVAPAAYYPRSPSTR